MTKVQITYKLIKDINKNCVFRLKIITKTNNYQELKEEG